VRAAGAHWTAARSCLSWSTTPQPPTRWRRLRERLRGDARPRHRRYSAAAATAIQRSGRSWPRSRDNADVVNSHQRQPTIRGSGRIILQVEDGVKQSSATYEVEVDGRTALARAIVALPVRDCVLIPGRPRGLPDLRGAQLSTSTTREVASWGARRMLTASVDIVIRATGGSYSQARSPRWSATSASIRAAFARVARLSRFPASTTDGQTSVSGGHRAGAKLIIVSRNCEQVGRASRRRQAPGRRRRFASKTLCEPSRISQPTTVRACTAKCSASPIDRETSTKDFVMAALSAGKLVVGTQGNRTTSWAFR